MPTYNLVVFSYKDSERVDFGAYFTSAQSVEEEQGSLGEGNTVIALLPLEGSLQALAVLACDALGKDGFGNKLEDLLSEMVRLGMKIPTHCPQV